MQCKHLWDSRISSEMQTFFRKKIRFRYRFRNVSGLEYQFRKGSSPEMATVPNRFEISELVPKYNIFPVKITFSHKN